MDILDELVCIPIISRLVFPYTETAPNDWVTLEWHYFTGEPYWQENDKHFRERIYG